MRNEGHDDIIRELLDRVREFTDKHGMENKKLILPYLLKLLKINFTKTKSDLVANLFLFALMEDILQSLKDDEIIVLDKFKLLSLIYASHIHDLIDDPVDSNELTEVYEKSVAYMAEVGGEFKKIGESDQTFVK